MSISVHDPNQYLGENPPQRLSTIPSVDVYTNTNTILCCQPLTNNRTSTRYPRERNGEYRHRISVRKRIHSLWKLVKISLQSYTTIVLSGCPLSNSHTSGRAEWNKRCTCLATVSVAREQLCDKNILPRVWRAETRLLVTKFCINQGSAAEQLVKSLEEEREEMDWKTMYVLFVAKQQLKRLSVKFCLGSGESYGLVFAGS